MERAAAGVTDPPRRAKTNAAGPNLVVDFTRGLRGSTIGVFIDGKKAGDVWGRKTQSHTLSPGHHTVGVNGGARRCRHPLDVEVREGTTFRLVAEWKGLSVRFSIVEE